MVIMAVYDYICTRVIKSLPKGLHRRIVAMRHPGTEQRLMKVRQRARRGMLRQILLTAIAGVTSGHLSSLVGLNNARP